MFKHIRALVFLTSVIFLASCGPQSVKGPSPEDTVLVNTTEIRPDWIDELDISEQQFVIEELEREGLELRDAVLADQDIWGDPDTPKVSVYFDLDRWVVRPADRPKVEQVANEMLRNPLTNVLLTGFCDWRGTTEYNLTLGERRANSVRDFLVQLGVDGRRISVLSRGDLDATVGASSAQMALERRVDILVTR